MNNSKVLRDRESTYSISVLSRLKLPKFTLVGNLQLLSTSIYISRLQIVGIELPQPVFSEGVFIHPPEN